MVMYTSTMTEKFLKITPHQKIAKTYATKAKPLKGSKILQKEKSMSLKTK